MGGQETLPWGSEGFSLCVCMVSVQGLMCLTRNLSRWVILGLEYHLVRAVHSANSPTGSLTHKAPASPKPLY